MDNTGVDDIGVGMDVNVVDDVYDKKLFFCEFYILTDQVIKQWL